MARSVTLRFLLVALGMGACTSPETGPMSLEALRDRSTYAALDQQEVASLAQAAKQYWATDFEPFTYLGVEHFHAGGVSHWMSIWKHEATALEFVLLPGGRFLMGSPESEPGRSADETQHWMTLDPFLAARTECTWQAWAIGADLPQLPQGHEPADVQLPVSGIGPIDVELWCAQLGLDFPTEAQWEYLSRAGTTTPWSFGTQSESLQEAANLGSLECPESWRQVPGIVESWYDGYGAVPAPVASFRSNAFGLFDVHGNLSEWCRDEYFDYAVTPEHGTGERPGHSGERLARGGNFGGAALAARSADRLTAGPGINPGGGGNHGFGFRPSLDLKFHDR
ncbi:MAG: formylglycine-generating enzyme family protein [Planctomycetota bacterium]